MYLPYPNGETSLTVWSTTAALRFLNPDEKTFVIRTMSGRLYTVYFDQTQPVTITACYPPGRFGTHPRDVFVMRLASRIAIAERKHPFDREDLSDSMVGFSAISQRLYIVQSRQEGMNNPETRRRMTTKVETYS